MRIRNRNRNLKHLHCSQCQLFVKHFFTSKKMKKNFQAVLQVDDNNPGDKKGIKQSKIEQQKRIMIAKSLWFVSHYGDLVLGSEASLWESENYIGCMHFESHSPEWRSLQKFSFQHCEG